MLCRYAYFDSVVVSGDEPHAKPHPTIFQTALAGCGETDMGKVVMVGDSLTADIEVWAKGDVLRCVWVCGWYSL